MPRLGYKNNWVSAIKKLICTILNGLTGRAKSKSRKVERDINFLNPLSEVINVNHYNNPAWMALHVQLEGFSTDKHVFKHTEGEIYRKGWEWTNCAYGLSHLGAIKKEARALGVGAGREPIIFWLAENIKEVIATDLYGNDTWTMNDGAEAPGDIIQDADKYCPRPFQKDRVRFEVADGTQLPYENLSFDFCWSLSSIEHFGGAEAAAEAIREMGRVTKHGGIICVASEYRIDDSSQRHPESFTREQIEDFIIPADSKLKLVNGMSWKLPPKEYLDNPINTLTEDVHRRKRHVILRDKKVHWTSFMLFFRKS